MAGMGQDCYRVWEVDRGQRGETGKGVACNVGRRDGGSRSGGRKAHTPNSRPSLPYLVPPALPFPLPPDLVLLVDLDA